MTRVIVRLLGMKRGNSSLLDISILDQNDLENIMKQIEKVNTSTLRQIIERSHKLLGAYSCALLEVLHSFFSFSEFDRQFQWIFGTLIY
jgi:hypothetical protein